MKTSKMLGKLTIIITALVLQSCSLSFSNVDTHGESEDVIDSDPNEDAEVSPTLDIPISSVP